MVWQLLQKGFEVQPVYCRAGMIWETIEESWLRKYLKAISSPLLRSLKILSLPIGDIYGSHWSISGTNVPDYESSAGAVYLPGRNIILLAKTAVYCSLQRLDRIAIGVLRGNPFPDATSKFFDNLGEILSKGLEISIKIERPLVRLTKSEVVKLGSDLPLELTFSCIKPADNVHCGLCNKCAERAFGFKEAKINDPTLYVSYVSKYMSKK